MRTKIIAAFPGSGKSYSHNLRKQISLDSDSSLFSWVYENGVKTRNPIFPQNYIEHIKENIGKYQYIFVSTHKEVRDALKDNCLFFYLVFPGFGAKEDYIKRYRERGSSEEFIQLLDKNWIIWNQELYYESDGCKKCVIGKETLEDFLKNLEKTNETNY